MSWNTQIGEGEGKRGTAEGEGWGGLEEQMRKGRGVKWDGSSYFSFYFRPGGETFPT